MRNWLPVKLEHVCPQGMVNTEEWKERRFLYFYNINSVCPLGTDSASPAQSVL